MEKEVRVRFAPSPTGHLHIGGARSALFSYLFARKYSGRFIVRFEDTDQVRNVECAEEKLLNNLRWLGIDWDESVDVGGDYGPYRCTDRLDIYRKYVELLLNENKAYQCFCTSEELEKERQKQINKGETPKYSGKCKQLTKEQKQECIARGCEPNIRFAVPDNESIFVNDLIRGIIDFDSSGIGDFIIMRPNGLPTYNFAVTIDDYLMRISHVIRGEEHLTNTPRQLLIYKAFSWETPQFAHVSLILNEDRQKMSKRDESIIQFVDQYKELGFLPEAVVNFIALFGWSPEGEKEIFSKEELVKEFSLERVNKSPAVFNVEKLYWMNNHYIKEAELERIIDLCLPYLKNADYISNELSEEELKWAEKLIELYKDQLNYGKEIIDLTKIFFTEEIDYDGEVVEILKEEYTRIVLEAFCKQLEGLSEFTPDAIKEILKNVQESTGYKGKKLFMPIRIAATGVSHGRDLPDTLYLLGKEKVITRLNNLLTNKI